MKTKKQRVALLATVFSMCGAAAAAASEGPAWDALEARVDSEVEAVLEANNIPGATVAVTKNGRLVLSKGYGLAMAANKAVPMKHDMRTRIGSVSKVVATGPSGYKLLKKKGLDPKTAKLYGQNGVFGNAYANDIKMGAKRFSPITAMAIAPDDKVYTWYANGKVSVGTSRDLDKYLPPRTFALPSGRNVSDIRGIAISKSSKVYAWYNDGALSIGQSRNLETHMKIRKNAKGDVIRVKMPNGKSMLNVIGIAIAKSNDHVYIWYDDGTVSSGTSTDFTKYFTGRRFDLAGSRYRIRGIGIAKNDHIYAWGTNGMAQSGVSTNLARYQSPYAYAAPALSADAADQENWYYDITIQNLLYHRSGFQRSGDQSGAEVMFGVSNDQLTYEQVHKHFLRTRPMRWKPGAGYSYSNHGFGLWTLIIEKLSGKPYRNYVINNFFNPIGVKGDIRPQKAVRDEKDAWPHERLNNGKFKLLPFKNSGLGLAAGGWTASAQTLLKITDYLDDSYTDQELAEMGWGRESKGKLEHNGRTGGGTAYVAMFPKGYRANNGANLSDIHVAIATNVATDAGPLENLASKIALAVPKSNIASFYDIWQGKPIN